LIETKEQCPVCGSDHTGYEFHVGSRTIERCQDCDVLFEGLYFSEEKSTLPHEFLTNPSVAPQLVESEAKVSQCIERLKDRGIQQGDRLWISGNVHAQFIDCAKDSGLEVLDSNLESVRANTIDACVLSGNLGESEYPVQQLMAVWEILKPGGLLLATVPTLDYPEARQQKRHWKQFWSRRVTYFDCHGLTALLVRAGYGQITMWSEAEGVIAVCQKKSCKSVRPVLSIVLPVYNECSTIQQLIELVLAKKFGSLDREIIIVESNSTDGSRELVQQYEAHPGVKVIYEDKPRGKGYAVRNGLSHASGDIILIQDADLEYDIEDYDALLAPITSFRRLFVLGSRHKGHWKMREFEDRNLLSTIFNSGQLFFTWLINITCGAQLKDPFTMYKVFHRECLYGLELESNRFDLDWEIVIKFIRKGLVPMEIAVNYTSRSFGDGKKVRPLIDPITWIIALVKFRYGRLYSHSDSERR